MLVDFVSLLMFHFTVLRSLRTVNMKRKHIFTDGKGAGSGACVDNIHLRGSTSSDEGACDFSSASQLRRSTGRALMGPSVSPCPRSPGPAHWCKASCGQWAWLRSRSPGMGDAGWWAPGPSPPPPPLTVWPLSSAVWAGLCGCC